MELEIKIFDKVRNKGLKDIFGLFIKKCVLIQRISEKAIPRQQ